MIGRFRMLRLNRLAGLAAASILFSVLAGAQAKAQALQCPDGETWDVDKAALRQVISSLPTYLNKQQPVLINLQALGASSGELLITFSHQNLQCIADFYRNQLDGSGTIAICKRPSC
jgi:hypothetical protein